MRRKVDRIYKMVRYSAVLLFIGFCTIPRISAANAPSQKLTKLSTIRCLVFEAVQDAEYILTTPSERDEDDCKTNGGEYSLKNKTEGGNFVERAATGLCRFAATVDLERNIIQLSNGVICDYQSSSCSVNGKFISWKSGRYLEHYVYSGLLDLWKIESPELEFEQTVLAHENVTFNLAIKKALNKDIWSTMTIGIYIRHLPYNLEANSWNMERFNKNFGVMTNIAETNSDHGYGKLTKLSTKVWRIFVAGHSPFYFITDPFPTVQEEMCRRNEGYVWKYKLPSSNGSTVTTKCLFRNSFDMEKNITEFSNGALCDFQLGSCTVNNRNITWAIKSFSENYLYLGYLDLWKFEFDLTVLAHRNVTLNLVLKKVVKENIWSTNVDGIYVQYISRRNFYPDLFFGSFVNYFGVAKERTKIYGCSATLKNLNGSKYLVILNILYYLCY